MQRLQGDDSSMSEAVTQRGPHVSTVSACLSLGLFFAWVTLGWNHGGTAFGAPIDIGAPLHICLQAAVASTFFALSFVKPSTDPNPENRYALIGTAAAIAGTLLLWMGSGLHSGAVSIIGSAVAGTAQGLFMGAWLYRYRYGTNGTFVLIAAASGAMFFVRLFCLLFDDVPTRALSLVLPASAVALFVWGPQNRQYNPSSVGMSPRPSTRMPFPPSQTISLLLCCLASGIASYGTVADSEQRVCLLVLASLAVTLVALFLGPARSTTLFVGLSLGVCACVSVALMVPAAPDWLPALVFAGFWLLEVYAISWFSQQNRHMSAWGIRGLAAVYALSAVANIVGMFIGEQVAYTAALVVTIAAFAITSVSSGRVYVLDGRDNSALPHASGGTSTTPSYNPTVAAEEFAHRYGLTEAETSVFAHLARGHALKQIALDLHISESTAKYHRRNVYQKCGVSSRQELINLVERDADEITRRDTGE